MSREGRNLKTTLQNTEQKDNTFPSLDAMGSPESPTKMQVNSNKDGKFRPYSVLNTVKSKKLDLIPKINASKEDVVFYKMLRLTDSYVGMDKVDFEVKRGKSRGGGAAVAPLVLDNKRQSNPNPNTNSALNHQF